MPSPSEREPRPNHPPPGRPILLRLLTYARPYAALIAVALALSFALSAARYVRVYLTRPLLDDVVLPHAALAPGSATPGWLPDLPFLAGEKPDAGAGAPAEIDPAQRAEVERRIWARLWEIAAIAAIVILAMPVTQFGRAYLVAHVLGRIHIDIQRDVCAKLLALPLRFHLDRRRGEVLARAMSDVGVAQGAMRLLFDDFLEAVAMTAVGASLLFYISWQLALVAALLGPPLFAVISVFGRRIRRTARVRQQTVADVTHRLVEILSGIKVIKAFRAEAFENAAFRKQTQKLFRRSMRVVKNRVLARSLVEMLNSGMAIGLLILGTLLVLGGRWGLSIGGLVAFAAVVSSTYRPIRTLARGWTRLADAQPAAERFFEVLDTPVEIRDAPDAVRIDGVHQGIRMRGVRFSYGRELVLRDVSLEARAGEVVAIVGRTGAGKTTLVDLLLRFHDPEAGNIEIDGIDLRRIARDSLLEQMAVVGQESFLFDGTIRDNLRYGRPDASDADLLAAARAAHVDEFARELPDGYDTEVGSLGVRLSGGQRQRIAIGRAILKNPSILIFDEATSSLDAKSERFVQEAIEALLGGQRTVLMIAHRLSTIRKADRIVVLENGSISQAGTHAELIRQGGLYRELVELQSTSDRGDPGGIRPN